MSNQDRPASEDSLKEEHQKKIKDSPEEKRQKRIEEEVKEKEELLDDIEDVATIKRIAKKEIRSQVRRRLLEEDETVDYKTKYEAAKRDKAEREKTMLILRVRSRIEELEKRFLKPYMSQYTRYQKWTAILNGDLRNLRSVGELMRFRSMITVAHDEFIPTICNLYGEFSDLAAHNITHPIPYDEASITQMLTNFGMVPDNTKINTVITKKTQQSIA